MVFVTELGESAVRLLRCRLAKTEFDGTGTTGLGAGKPPKLSMGVDETPVAALVRCISVLLCCCVEVCVKMLEKSSKDVFDQRRNA